MIIDYHSQMRPRSLSIAILLGLFAAPLPARAQETTGDAKTEVLASWAALEAASSYRTTTTIETPETEAGFDFPPIVTEVANGRRRTDIRLEMEGMDMRMLGVNEPGRVAAYLESKAMEEMQRTMDAQMAQMARQSVMSGIMGFIAGGFNPMSIVGQVISMGVGFAMQKAAQKMADQAFELNKWKCFDQPEEAESPSGSITSAEFLGDETIDGTPVAVYRVVVQHDQEPMEMQLSTLGRGGLPRRMVFETEQGGMTMDYHDFGAPIEIEFPACE
jgi:hypothetical protein